MGNHEENNTVGIDGSASDPAPEEILATGPSTKELDSALANPPRRTRSLSSTMVLVVGVVVAVGFVGGLFLGRASAPESATPAFPGGGNFPNGATGADGGNLPWFDGGGFTAGTVSRIEGDTVYVETPDGETVEVRTSGDTDVQVTSEGTVGDLAEGETVVVQGDAGDDGSLDATSIVEGGLGFGGGLPGDPNQNG
jgi:hypothetical protein